MVGVLLALQWSSRIIEELQLCVGRSRNDIVFQKTKSQTSLQILFRATYLTRAWAILHKEEDREAIATACRMLETVGMDFFATNGWMFSNRLGL
jgi:hypothetical protein